MDLRNELVLEVKKDERVYRFSLPGGAPLGESSDAVFEMFLQVDKWHKDAVEKAKGQKEAEAPQQPAGEEGEQK